ncbi:MAG: BACON domain-containing protein [Pyrinomonadaceae bacterium MAG19_C2-C3]|nr:BACON domain-containing protein [Pyrinomonadaceae bacterium MAG19_C2-C3]
MKDCFPRFSANASALFVRRVAVLTCLAVLFGGMIPPPTTAQVSSRTTPTKARLTPHTHHDGNTPHAVEMTKEARRQRRVAGAENLRGQMTDTGEGGEYLIVYENGNSVCRRVSPRDTFDMHRRDPNIELQVITAPKSEAQAAATPPGLQIVLRGTSQLNNFPQARDAFLRAARTWENLIATPITVIVDVDYGTTRFGEPYDDPDILGATDSQIFSFRNTSDFSFYTFLRAFLLNDASSAAEAALYNLLPLAALPVDITNTAGSQTAESIAASSANFRALGIFDPVANPRIEGIDAPSIGFNSSFSYDFDPSNGIDADKLDFDAVVVHEIGHVLGFNSFVGAKELNTSSRATASVWDFFRFRSGTTLNSFTTAPRILSSGGTQTFFAGANESMLSTGRNDGTGGDGNQATHWKDDRLTGLYIGIMDPTGSRGDRNQITANDLNAIEAFGYTLRTSTSPPPNGDTIVALASGASVSGSIAAPPGGGTRYGTTQYTIEVPVGATGLRIDLNGTPDIDLYVRQNRRTAKIGDEYVTDFVSGTASGVEFLNFTSSGVQSAAGGVFFGREPSYPLLPGTYFIGIDNFGPDAVSYTLTATVGFVATPPATCTYDVASSSVTMFAGSGGTGTVNVSFPTDCGNFSATSNDRWIRIESVDNNNGTTGGSLLYTVEANTTGRTRTGSIMVANRVITITQTRKGRVIRRGTRSR